MKTCLGCRWFEFYVGFGGSDVTPPEGTTLRCQKRHWSLGSYGDDAHDLRKALATAEHCPDFEESL